MIALRPQRAVEDWRRCGSCAARFDGPVGERIAAAGLPAAAFLDEQRFERVETRGKRIAGAAGAHRREHRVDDAPPFRRGRRVRGTRCRARRRRRARTDSRGPARRCAPSSRRARARGRAPARTGAPRFARGRVRERAARMRVRSARSARGRPRAPRIASAWTSAACAVIQSGRSRSDATRTSAASAAPNANARQRSPW